MKEVPEERRTTVIVEAARCQPSLQYSPRSSNANMVVETNVIAQGSYIKMDLHKVQLRAVKIGAVLCGIRPITPQHSPPIYKECHKKQLSLATLGISRTYVQPVFHDIREDDEIIEPARRRIKC
ncbi:hypothetical protein KIN20_033808 [Parelaphostrongylus tenuis]|uniref:Uncharacterized protein n=1 Tax=Parelaphostrongylus tenuis TaxID=148309 RepID=A0AAD5WIR0_PARTN|nr:hypothetical protein KIN20_033808 [Parelaphostrongylus tenuis]